jgi:hypothetical protein
VLCQDNGPIESIAAAMADLLSRPWDQRDGWIEEALETRSLPLIHRVMIALRALRMRSNADCAAWGNGQWLNGGLSWLEVECNRCKTRASLPLFVTL